MTSTVVSTVAGGVADLDLIVVRDGVESPAPGTWEIPAQPVEAGVGSMWARRSHRLDVHGVLHVADDGTTLELSSFGTASDDPLLLAYRGVLVDTDRVGHWRFDGDATVDGTLQRLSLDVAYQGVYRSGGYGVAWLAVTGAHVSPAAHARQRLVRSLVGDLNAIVEVGQAMTGTARIASAMAASGNS